MNLTAGRTFLMSLLPFLCTLNGCSDVQDEGFTDLNIHPVCMAYDCHNGTQLRIFPPISGAHLSHLGGEGGIPIGCETCHFHYDRRTGWDTMSNPQHKNGIINGWNWLLNTNAPGDIVIWNPDLAGAKWTDATQTCSGLPSGCHGSRTWQSGGD